MSYRMFAKYDRVVWLAVIFVCAILCRAAGASAEARYVSLELLLAIDSSSSVSDEEFDLQMQGIALAFEHPLIFAAIEESGSQGLAVSLVQWSSLNNQAVALGWTQIKGIRDALSFEQSVRGVGHLIDGGSTSLSAVMNVGAIESNGIEGERRVIDVSGDGRANEGDSPAQARAYANGWALPSTASRS